jgi:hypothetical protein
MSGKIPLSASHRPMTDSSLVMENDVPADWPRSIVSVACAAAERELSFELSTVNSEPTGTGGDPTEVALCPLNIGTSAVKGRAAGKSVR